MAAAISSDNSFRLPAQDERLILMLTNPKEKHSTEVIQCGQNSLLFLA